MFNRLIFNPDMTDFLEKTSRNKISMILIHASGSLLSIEGNFISRDDKELDILSYLPKSKYVEGVDVYANNVGRVRIKIGRFVRKFLSKDCLRDHGITDQSIEDFVNMYKSFFQRNVENIKVVEGRDILKWYLEDNYRVINCERYGTLWASCMRQLDKNKYLSLYTKNPGIKMLILLTDDNKLSARALLWDDVTDINGKSYKIMDRIYSINDHDVHFLKDWAKENGYIHKMDQNAKSERYFIVDDNPTALNLSVKLTKSDFEYYPYLDTFKFFDERKGCLSNSDFYPFQYILVQTNGSKVREEPVEEEPEPEFDEDLDDL